MRGDVRTEVGPISRLIEAYLGSRPVEIAICQTKRDILKERMVVNQVTSVEECRAYSTTPHSTDASPGPSFIRDSPCHQQGRSFERVDCKAETERRTPPSHRESENVVKQVPRANRVPFCVYFSARAINLASATVSQH